MLIRRASLIELKTVPGITEKLAQKIMSTLGPE